MRKNGEPAMLALEDGTAFAGTSFGAPGERAGEVVFNTSMMGYQEILTDPSYKGQIVTMTYPLIGNYGVNRDDVESDGLHLEGLVVREYSPYPSNWRSQDDLGDYLRSNGVQGIEGVDTRRLTTLIRTEGVMRAVISTEDLNADSLVQKAREFPEIAGRDLVCEVTTAQRYAFSGWRTSGGRDARSEEHHGQLSLAMDTSALTRQRRRAPSRSARLRVIALDYGCKRNILRELTRVGCDVLVLPAAASADDVLAYEPDGVVLSNGPGDPDGVPYA
ncbi:MAG: carbamoyl phosphate synthase small subunit, partial [Armatimonadota bacterium]